ncbi:MAG: WD40 repeat domain-containing protein, partial [Anaerolineae bacterium]|nr:WD40 repeat domain-containing protein [Anaerolineae bacterium]
DLFASEEDVSPVRETVDAFADFRLLTTASDPETRRPTVEIAHEALIRRWKRLQDWLNANRDALRTQARLSIATQQWLENSMDESFLATGARLAAFRELLDNEIASLNTSEQAYLQTSINQQTELEWARLRRFRRVLALAIVAMAAAVLAASFWVQAEVARNVAVQERDRADDAAAVARAGELAASAALRTEDSPDLALLLGLEALAVRDIYESRNGLLSVLQSNPRLEAFYNGHRDNVRAVAVNDDQTRMVSGGRDTRVILWDLQTRQAIAILTQHEGIVRDVAFSPDGSSFASIGEDGRVLIASSEDGTLYHNVPWEGEVGWALSFDPSGEQLAAADTDGMVRIINVETGEISDEFRAHDEPVYALAFSPDGEWLATGSQDETIALWDTATWERVRTLEGHENWVMALAFSPDGTQLASGSNDTVVRLWDVQTGELLANFSGHRGAVRRVAFDEAGRALLTGGADAIFLLWDVSGRQSLGGIRSVGNVPIYDFAWNGNDLTFGGDLHAVIRMSITAQDRFGAVLGQQAEGINSLAYLPDGQHIASAGGNESSFDITLWDSSSEESDVLVLHTGSVTGLATSGDLLLSAGVDQRFAIWRGSELVTSYSVGNSIFSLAANDDTAALGLNNGAIQIWRRDAESDQWTEAATLNGHSQRVTSLAFSPDGSQLASGDAEGSLVFWDVASGDMLVAIDGAHLGGLEALAYVPDGGVLVSSGRDALIRRWDTTDYVSIGEPMDEHTARVTSLAFSPDGSMMVSGSYDNHVLLWDTAQWRTLGQPFALHESFISDVVFSPDGTQVASGDLDGTLVLWRTGIDEWSRVACAIVNRNFNPTEMQQYFSEIFPLVEVCEGGDSVGTQ